MLKKCLIGFAVLIALAVVNSAVASSSKENIVKNGTLQLCPKKTMEQLVNGFFANPLWSSNKIDENKIGVNVEGNATWLGQPSTIRLDFIADQKSGSFSYESIKINNQPAPRLIGNGVFIKMCAAN